MKNHEALYPNLKAEMARCGLTGGAAAKALGKNPGTFSAKLNEPSRFRLDEAIRLRDRFFPGMSLDYLFERKEESQAAG